MKIERDAAAGKNTFTGYGEGYVEVNGGRLREGALVSANEVVPGWGPQSVAGLAAEHVQAIALRAPEIVLLGSGNAFAFPDPALLAPLHRARIGVEVMDTRAACRTYNILLGEGRNVLAALIIEK